MDEQNANGGFEEQKPEENGGKPQAGAKKKSAAKKIWIAVGAVAIALVCFFTGWFARYYAIDERARTLMWLVDTIDDRYYKEISDETWNELFGEFYSAVLPDKFCSYYSPEEYKKLLSEGKGVSRDTGLAAIDDNGALRVYRVVGNSPAALVGLKSGMTIYRFGTSEENLKAGSRDEFYALSGSAIWLECGYEAEDTSLYRISGDTYLASYCSYRDSEASFDFYADADGKKLVLTQSKEQMPLAGADNETAYIAIAEFNGKVQEEFAALLKLMKERGRKNLVIDLRRNGGGYLTSFQSIASHLVKNAEGKNPVVATAKYRSGKQVKFQASGNDYAEYFAENSRIKILADEWTASASECLMGALVDYGTVAFSDIYLRKTEGASAHSYGKGVMQSAYTAANGSAVRVTSAEIFWPSGRSIHGTGVTEETGAVGVVAPLLPGRDDAMLRRALADLA